MIAPWRKALQQASFRGVPFEVEGRDLTMGRNIVTHEFAFSEEVLSEDLGRKADGWSVDAYLWGPDYLTQLETLKKALREPGAGEYVDRWGGRHWVLVNSASIRQTTKEGGWATIRLDLVEAGTIGPTASRLDTAALVDQRADEALPAIADDFAGSFDVTGPAFLADDAVALVGEAAGLMGDISAGIASGGRPLSLVQRQISALTGGAADLVGSPARLAAQIQQLIGGVLNLSLPGLPRFRAASAARSYGSSWTAPAPITANRIVQADNREALAALVRRTAIVEEARASAQAEYPVYQDAVATRDAVTGRLDSEMRTAPDSVHLPLRRLHAAVAADITTRGADLARLSEVTPQASLPALVLAHRYYGDARREGDILDRNPHIRHPLAVPGGMALRVVADA